MPMESQAQSPMLLDQVRNVMRLHHYSIHTERSYLDWIKRYIKFHHMRSREDLAGAEAKIEAFLTSLAVDGKRRRFDSESSHERPGVPLPPSAQNPLG